MDAATILVSAAVSAIVGTGVSLTAVRTVTVRQAKAEAAHTARKRLAATVRPLRYQVAQYRAGMLASLRREPGTSDSQDHALATMVLAAAADLPWWRRRLVRRRCLRVVGPFWTRLAELSPADPVPTMGSVLAPVFSAQFQGAVDGSPLDGLLHRALCEPREHPVLVQLDRQLARLGAGI